MFQKLANQLFFHKKSHYYLLAVSVLLLLTCLGGRDLWTQEHRWADIVSAMFLRHDFLHPVLGNQDYYDKPLLSYWLMAFFAKLFGGLTVFALRLPSVLAGGLAIYSIYLLGKKLHDHVLGILAGWMLLTTFYFLFWARVSSADMLNLAGSLFAVAWYQQKKQALTFFNYTIFFIILALTALCKGLIGVVIPAIAILLDLVMTRTFLKQINWRLLCGFSVGLFIYFIPFLASSFFHAEAYHENGLYLVYRENILRYFHPFDHVGPIYTYLLYLPIYLLPWTIFLIPAVYLCITRFQSLPEASRWIWLTSIALFLFLTFSGSRRSYYVLPLVPFVILCMADSLYRFTSMRYLVTATRIICLSALLLLIGLDWLPAWQDARTGALPFVALLKKESERTAPWAAWQIVMLDAESKLDFYLQLPQNAPHYAIGGHARAEQTSDRLKIAWPFLTHLPSHTIFITRKQYLPLLAPYFKGYRLVALKASSPLKTSRQQNEAPIAFLPDNF